MRMLWGKKVKCLWYKAKLVTVAGIRKRNVVKIRGKKVAKSRVWGIWLSVESMLLEVN